MKIFLVFFMRFYYEFKLRLMSVEEIFEFVKKRFNKVRVKDMDDLIYLFMEEVIKFIYDLVRGNFR